MVGSVCRCWVLVDDMFALVMSDTTINVVISVGIYNVLLLEFFETNYNINSVQIGGLIQNPTPG